MGKGCENPSYCPCHSKQRRAESESGGPGLERNSCSALLSVTRLLSLSKRAAGPRLLWHFSSTLYGKAAVWYLELRLTLGRRPLPSPHPLKSRSLLPSVSGVLRIQRPLHTGSGSSCGLMAQTRTIATVWSENRTSRTPGRWPPFWVQTVPHSPSSRGPSSRRKKRSVRTTFP